MIMTATQPHVCAHRTPAAWHACTRKQIAGLTERRGSYGQILRWSDDEPISREHRRVDAARVLGYYESMEALTERRLQFDRKGRGEALNHDLYGYDPRAGLAVIQTRQFVRRSAHRYPELRKSYFLVGHNEGTDEPFRHPVSSAIVHGAIKAGRCPVEAAQCWIFRCTSEQLASSTRQGDVLCIPAKPSQSRQAHPLVSMQLTLADSHVLTAAQLRMDPDRDRLYALDPELVHTKDQHAPVKLEGWFRVEAGREAAVWNFAQRMGD